MNVIGVAASGDGKAGAGKVGQAGKKDKKDPTLLDHQRCNIVCTFAPAPCARACRVCVVSCVCRDARAMARH